MTQPEPDPPDDDRERKKLMAWRRDTLARAGFDELYVEVFATAPDLDLHRVVKLKREGCADELVARIVL
jgi:hypothetical protein